MFKIFGNQDQSIFFQTKQIRISFSHHFIIVISTSPQHKITVSAFITAMSTGKRKAVFDGHVSLICTNTCHHLNPSPCNRQNGGPGMRKKRRKSEKKKATLPSHTHTPAHLLYFYSQQFGTTYMQRAIKYQSRRSS